MKSPRVIDHKGYFYITYYLPGNKYAVKEPVGEMRDVPVTKSESGKVNPDWWKASKHREKIRIALREATHRKAEYENTGIYKRPEPKRIHSITLERLLSLYNEEMAIASASQSPETIAKRLKAIKKVQDFDKYALPRTMDRAWAGRFKDWMGENYSPETCKSYFGSLRALFNFAIEEGHVITRKNPFDRIEFASEYKEPRRVNQSDEIRVFDHIFKTNIRLFWQIMMLRVSGYRAKEICNMRLEGIADEWVTTDVKKLNGQTRRIDKFPRTECINLILSNAEGNSGFVFWYRSRSNPTHAIEDACREIGIPIFGSHQLKKNYLQELNPFLQDNPYLRNLMAHHLPKGMNFIADRHYIGPNLELMKQAAEKAQTFWAEYLQSKVIERKRLTEAA